MSLYNTKYSSSVTSTIHEKINLLEKRMDINNTYLQKDITNIASKQMKYVETVDGIIQYIMLMLITLALLEIGYTSYAYWSISIESVLLHGFEACVYISTFITIFIVRKDLK